jgi:urea transport system permease protein
VETRRVDAITFFLGSGLAGLAGCAMTLIGNVVPDMGQTYIVDSFLVVVTGGVGKIAGAIVSGLGIGFLTKVLESFYEAVYGKVLILALIVIFLQFKPRGLFPDKGRIAED